MDIGAGDGFRLSNTQLLLEQGWRGLRFDGQAAGDVISQHITAENVNDVLAAHNCPSEVGLLSIDIDGIDWHVVNAMALRPRIVICEYNAAWTGHVRVAPNDPGFVHQLDSFYGASAAAWSVLMRARGYHLVAVNALNLVWADSGCGLPEVSLPVQPSYGFGLSRRTDWLADAAVTARIK